MIGSLSAVSVKQNVVERNWHEVQAVPAEMQTRNALYVADMGQNASVRMTKISPPNKRMQRLLGSAFDRHRAEIQQPEEEIKVNYAVD